MALDGGMPESYARLDARLRIHPDTVATYLRAAYGAAALQMTETEITTWPELLSFFDAHPGRIPGSRNERNVELSAYDLDQDHPGDMLIDRILF